MSTLAITAAHFVAFPVRYAVGRWYNIPTNTMIAFNATDIGLSILAFKIIEYIDKKQWMKPMHLFIAGFSMRVVISFIGVYMASILTEPMPSKAAFITCLAGIFLTLAVYNKIKSNKPNN